MSAQILNAESLDKYQTDGFLAIREFLAGEQLHELINNVDRFVREIVPGLPAEHAFYEDKADAGTLKQIQNIEDYDPWFHEFVNAGRFQKLAEQLLGGPVVPKNLQYFSKPAGVGRPTPPHQDGYYFMLDPCEAITMWLALDTVDEENGCVRYVRGSYERGMREHARTQTLGFSQGIVDYPTREDSTAEVALVANSGDLLIHDAMTIHRADGNTSADRSRRALGFVYYSERARVDAEAHAVYQQRLALDMKAQGKI
jgi:phytanoyl-CoA hydroxylase